MFGINEQLQHFHPPLFSAGRGLHSAASPLFPDSSVRSPLSPGGCGPARCSWCGGRGPSPAEDASAPRSSAAAWTETPPVDSARRAGFWADWRFGNAPQSREGRGTSAPGPQRLTPFSPTTTSFSALWPDSRVASYGPLEPTTRVFQPPKSITSFLKYNYLTVNDDQH